MSGWKIDTHCNGLCSVINCIMLFYAMFTVIIIIIIIIITPSGLYLQRVKNNNNHNNLIYKAPYSHNFRSDCT